MTKKATKAKKSDINLIANNHNNNIKIIGHPIKPNKINIRILLKYFKELLLIGNINVSLDVSKIGRRRGNEFLKKGKIAHENNIISDSWYLKFYVLSMRVRSIWISKTIQKLQESNFRGAGANLQWLLEQQAPEDFRKIVENSDSNALGLILALQNSTRSINGKIENQKSIPEKIKN